MRLSPGNFDRVQRVRRRIVVTPGAVNRFRASTRRSQMQITLSLPFP
jgi:hypothetical protein